MTQELFPELLPDPTPSTTPQPVPKTSGGATNGHLLELWRFDMTGHLKPGTSGEYARYLGYLCEYRNGASLLNATPVELKSFLLANSNRWTPATLNFGRRAMRSFYGWATAEELVDANPTANLRAFREPVPPVRVADGDVRKALVAAADTTRNKALISVLFGTGMRRGELCALRLQDVDLEAGVILVRTSKTGRPRVVPVDPDGLRWLRRWIKERARDIARCSVPDHDALWTNRQGEPLGYAGVRMVFRRLSDLSGIPFSSHDARRGFATAWIRAGGSETALQQICGWANIGMVQRYTRMNAADLAIDEAKRLWGQDDAALDMKHGRK